MKSNTDLETIVYGVNAIAALLEHDPRRVMRVLYAHRGSRGSKGAREALINNATAAIIILQRLLRGAAKRAPNLNRPRRRRCIMRMLRAPRHGTQKQLPRVSLHATCNMTTCYMLSYM